MISTWWIQFFLAMFGQSDACNTQFTPPTPKHTQNPIWFWICTVVMLWWRCNPCRACLFNLWQLDLHHTHWLLPQEQLHLYTTSQRYEWTPRGKGFLLTSNSVDLCELLRWLSLGYELPTCIGWASKVTWVPCTLYLGIRSYAEVSQRLTNQSCT